MLARRAVLIQYIGEYLEYIKPYLNCILITEYHKQKFNIDEIIKWIICEELELVYGLFTHGHEHNKEPYLYIHNRLMRDLPINLSRFTTNYIKAPKLYNNIDIRVELNKFDLSIIYYTSTENYICHQNFKLKH